MDKPYIRVGISSCLLGQNVRFDGGHKLDTLITDALGQYFEWIPVCPEMEIGLGAPRESLRLIGDAENVRLIAIKSGTDHTQTMTRWAGQRLAELAQLEMYGYILKKDSPSCGMERVHVYDKDGMARHTGSGFFAALLRQNFDMLPVEEEGRLHDPAIRENFVERVFAYQRWQEFVKAKPRRGDLVDFHTRHKLTLSSHHDGHYRRLGRMLAHPDRRKTSALLEEYGRLFMKTLCIHATAHKHANVLFHILGHLKKEIDASDKAELVQCIENYRQGFVPLIVPITLFVHHLRRHPVPWLQAQTYLNPCHAELRLCNQV